MRFPLPGSGAGAVELAGVAASLAPAPAANAVAPLSLRWRAETPPPVLDVSLRLTDDLGQIWAQHDYEPWGVFRISDCELRIRPGPRHQNRQSAIHNPQSAMHRQIAG